MKGSFHLMTFAGIDVGLHYTWLIIFALITWSLATGFFPQVYPGWDTATYWITGGLASILLFVSVLIHEIAHSLVARGKGMSVTSITLFIFGGVSNLEDEPPKASTEFLMSVVGPLSSLILAGVFWAILLAVPSATSPLGAMLTYLALINAILAGFNLLPAFPLDGGRVFRSILWGSTGNLMKATNIAATVGKMFAWALIGIGVFQLFGGNILGGIWMGFIGWFLANAADSSRRETTMRHQLANVKVRDAMSAEPPAIDPDMPVSELVRDIFRRRFGRAVPVCEDGQLSGIVTLTDVKELPPDKWEHTPVRDILTRDPLYHVKPDDDLATALELITKHDVNQVLVLREGQCAGIVSRADILDYLSLKRELRKKK